MYTLEVTTNNDVIMCHMFIMTLCVILCERWMCLYVVMHVYLKAVRLCVCMCVCMCVCVSVGVMVIGNCN